MVRILAGRVSAGNRTLVRHYDGHPPASVFCLSHSMAIPIHNYTLFKQSSLVKIYYLCIRGNRSNIVRNPVCRKW